MSNQQPSLSEAGLEVLASGLNLAELDLRGGDTLWEEVRRYTRESHLEDLADRCLAGRSAPRLWAVMEAPSAGPAAVATGLGLASVLADRGQAVVLLDGDEQEPRLTRWIGRTEQEGWIDMVRFGASLHASSAPLPSDNRRGSVIGVGSFAPTGITPEEVADLLGRLRHQADDVVMVLPAKLRSQPWVAAAHIRLLCWDLLSRGGADTRTIVNELERMGGRPAYLIGFGVEEFCAIQQRLTEEPVAPPADVPVIAEPADHPAAEPGDPPSPEPPVAAAVESAPDEGVTVEPPRRRTSGVFIFVAVAAVACLALVGWFMAGQLRGTDPQVAAPAVVVVERPADVAVIDPQAVPEAEPEVEPEAEPEVEPGAEPEEAVSDPQVGVLAELDVPAGPSEAGEQGESTTVPVIEQDAGSTFDLAPFRQPVGEAGWALWVYSLSDRRAAAVEVRELERRGLVAVTREVQVEDRGLWYRVYTGSFASRAEAAAAAEPLKAALRHDWAVPSPF